MGSLEGVGGGWDGGLDGLDDLDGLWKGSGWGSG